MIQVKSLCSPRTNKEVPNQFVITTEKGEYYQSYQTVIAFIPNNQKPILSCSYDYSRTTMKYLCQFLGFSSIKEVEKRNYAIVPTIDIV